MNFIWLLICCVTIVAVTSGLEYSDDRKSNWYVSEADESINSLQFPKDDKTRIHGENGWYIPTADGSTQWIDMEDYENNIKDNNNDDEIQGNIKNSKLFNNEVKFYLYTRDNPTKHQEIIETYSSIQNSNFNASLPTKFAIHGWLDDSKFFINKKLAAALLDHVDINMILVRWLRGRGEYIIATNSVEGVGKKVASMIDYLHQTFGLSYDTLEIVGHSLGAHVAGFTGKKVKYGQINKIVGLDPALPLFSYNKPEQRLSSTDAFYVESIHTNGGELGFLKPIGKNAFYPNGGKNQPGCTILDIAGICAHLRAVNYYIEAIRNNNFPAIKCPTYKNAAKNKCGSTYSSLKMMDKSNAYTNGGTFFVPVNKKYPYGVGDSK